MAEIKQIPPHGGKLINRLADEKTKKEILARADKMPRLTLDEWELSDLDLIAVGALSPFTGFMGKKDYESVLDNMHLDNGLVWTIPITLSTDREQARKLKIGHDIMLCDADGRQMAILRLEEKFEHPKEKEAKKVFGTTDLAHPGVARLKKMGEILLAGEVTVLERPPADEFAEYRMDPAETRALFKSKGWRRIVGFQTRNPIHRAHEYIQKCALEIVDGLYLNPLIGETKKGDISGKVRMRCYRAIIDNYFSSENIVLGIYPAAMRYAGPREAIFHAIIRKNYGCTHFIVGRDHAGVGRYYDTFAAHRIFDEFEPGELGIVPLLFDSTFYCKKCGQMASGKTCPHGPEDHVAMSGTEIRNMLRKGEFPPPEVSRPEVARVLIEAYAEMEKEEEYD